MLLNSELPLLTVITNAPVILSALDNGGVITLFEGKGLEALGLEPNETVGESVFDLYRDRPGFLESARRALAGESINTTIELDGVAYKIRSSSLRAANGEVAGVIGVATDVTEHKQAEEAYKESEHRFTRMPSNAHACVYRCRDEPLYPNEFASDYALELTGYPPEDLLVGGPVSFGELIVEEERVWAEVQGSLERGGALRGWLQHKAAGWALEASGGSGTCPRSSPPAPSTGCRSFTPLIASRCWRRTGARAKRANRSRWSTGSSPKSGGWFGSAARLSWCVTRGEPELLAWGSARHHRAQADRGGSKVSSFPLS